MITREKLDEHIKENIKDKYGVMVVISALYKKIYKELPKIGLSGQQAEFIEELLKELPKEKV